MAGSWFDIWRPAMRRFAGTKARKRAWQSRRDWNPGRLSPGPVWQALPVSRTYRNPMLLLRFPGFVPVTVRYAFRGSLFHEPTRCVSPLFHFRQFRKESSGCAAFFFITATPSVAPYGKGKRKENRAKLLQDATKPDGVYHDPDSGT